MATMTKQTAEQTLEAVRAEAFAYGRCCEMYQENIGGFHCHACGQATFAMLHGVQNLLGASDAMTHEEHYRAAVTRRAAPRLLAACEAFTGFAFSEAKAKHGDQEALKRFCALKRQARAAIAQAKGEKAADSA